MIWERTESKNVLRCGEWAIIKFPWKETQTVYCLWHGDDFVGRYLSAKEAKERASAGRSEQSNSNNPESLDEGVSE